MSSETATVLLTMMTCVLAWPVFASPQAAQAQSVKRGVSRQSPAAFPVTARLPPEEIGHIGHLDYVNGFRGIKFGTEVSAVSGLRLLKEFGPLKVYAREQESLSLGNGEASNIVYRFLNGKFMDVGVFASGRDNEVALKQLVEMAYGAGVHSASTPDGLYWRGQKANGRMVVKNQSAETEFWLGSNALQDEYEQYLKGRVRDAARSL